MIVNFEKFLADWNEKAKENSKLNKFMYSSILDTLNKNSQQNINNNFFVEMPAKKSHDEIPHWFYFAYHKNEFIYLV